MATLEDIVAATKILSEDTDSVMGGSGSKPNGNRTKSSKLRKCNGGSESDSVVNEQIVESEVIGESNFQGKVVKSHHEKNEIGENSLDENGIDDSNIDGEGALEEVKDRGSEFRVGDFVWGKIKSHPWWPGQVYDPNDASEFAMKHKQEGRLLVAFFGDGSWSWCSPSQLRSFLDNFSELSVGSSSKSFLNAVEKATNEIGKLMELEMICECIPKEKRDSLANREVTNAVLREGVMMPEIDLSRVSFPCYEPKDVFERVVELAKVVSVGNLLDLAVLRSWLSAFYYFNGGHLLAVYHEPFHIEGLEDKSKDANGVADDFSVPIEVPILGPQDDDWLSSPTVGSSSSQAPTETKVSHRRKQRSVAEIMGENKNMNTKPESRKFAKEGSDVEKPTTTRKRKKDNEGELKGAGTGSDSSTRKKSRKVANGEDDGAEDANGGKVPKKIDVENTSQGGEESEIVTTPRERKKSKYLSPPYTNLAWRVGNSSFKFESPRLENDKPNKITAQAEEQKEEAENANEPISKSRDNESHEEKLPNQLQETLDTSVDTGLEKIKGDKKLSFPVSEVDVVVDELLLDIEQAALDPFYLREKGSLDTVWGFVSSLRSSTYLHGSDYKIYHKRISGGNQKSLSSQLKVLGNEQKRAKSPEQTTTPRASKRQRKSKKAANAEAVQGKTLPCLILAFTPGFALPLKEEVVGLFSKFGCLNTEETKIETDSHSVRIVYSNDSDAEAALKSSLTQCPFGSENVNYMLQLSSNSHPKVSSRAPEDDLVLDLNTMRRKLEITTAILENYQSKFSSEEKLSLKEEMKGLMEKIEAIGGKVRVVAEKIS